MGIHLLHCAHGNEHIGTHDVVHDTFGGCHARRKQILVFPSNKFNSSHSQVNIVLTKDGICTLVNVVIVNLTQVDLLFPMWFKPKNGIIAIDTLLINYSF
jgi:hypothetical protein